MLKNIPPILSPELMKILLEMGHGDEIVLADGNFPAASVAQRLDKLADNFGMTVERFLERRHSCHYGPCAASGSISSSAATYVGDSNSGVLISHRSGRLRADPKRQELTAEACHGGHGT